MFSYQQGRLSDNAPAGKRDNDFLLAQASDARAGAPDSILPFAQGRLFETLPDQAHGFQRSLSATQRLGNGAAKA